MSTGLQVCEKFILYANIYPQNEQFIDESNDGWEDARHRATTHMSDAACMCCTSVLWLRLAEVEDFLEKTLANLAEGGRALPP